MNLKISNLSKSFDDRPIFSGINLSLISGQIYCLMGPSGSGKTTFFRILLGLETAQEGSVKGLSGKKISAVFQENRLCEEFSSIDNITMTASGPSSLLKKEAIKELSLLLPEESLFKPAATLSGGMKRRVAIVRALWKPSDLVLMDEPFGGLDEDTKRKTIEYVLSHSKDKLIIISTHQESDISLLNGTLIQI